MFGWKVVSMQNLWKNEYLNFTDRFDLKSFMYDHCYFSSYTVEVESHGVEAYRAVSVG